MVKKTDNQLIIKVSKKVKAEFKKIYEKENDKIKEDVIRNYKSKNDVMVLLIKSYYQLKKIKREQNQIEDEA